MRVSVERIRRWFLVGIVALTATVAGVIGIARWRAKEMLRELPKKLGADIRSDTNGFTYSQSIKGRTVFTIHAARAIQRQNGVALLHDASILLYEKAKDGETPRADRIEGNEFEYDQNSGVVKAAGEVHIDIQAPVSAAGKIPKEDAQIHVNTSGLVFAQKLGVAATDALVEIRTRDLAGNAVGAEFDSNTGTLILRHQVELHQIETAQPSTLRASYAEMDRTKHTMHLTEMHLQRGKATLQSQTGEANVGEDGILSNLHAEGSVVLTQGDFQARAPHATATITPQHTLTNVHLFGVVVLQSSESQSTAQDAVVDFVQGEPGKVTLTGGVHTVQQQEQQKREMWGDRMEIALATHDKHTFAQQVRMGQGGRIEMTDTSATHASVTKLRADHLTGDLATVGEAQYLSRIVGNGNAVLEQTLADGTNRDSTAQTMEVAFPPPAPKQKNQTGREAAKEQSFQSSVLIGKVHWTSQQPADPKRKREASHMEAFAQRVQIAGDTMTATLQGSPRIESDGFSLSGNEIHLSQGNGNANALGDVRGSYQSTQGMVHVIAATAEMQQENGMATFHGDADKPVRMWQGASQLEAPWLSLSRKNGSLQARADATGKVHMRMVPETKKKTAEAPGPVTVEAPQLDYHDGATPVAFFEGGVLVQQRNTVVRSKSLTALWDPTTKAKGTVVKPAATIKPNPSGMFGNTLQSLTARGNVVVQQKGRIGQGEALLYTPADETFLLTGTPGTPPVVTDQTQGTLTADSLRFGAAGDSIIVAAAPGKRVHAETRVQR